MNGERKTGKKRFRENRKGENQEIEGEIHTHTHSGREKEKRREFGK